MELRECQKSQEKMKTVLISGCCGFIGQNLVPKLVNDYNIIHTWVHSRGAASMPYLLPDSSIIYPFRVESPTMSAGGVGGGVAHIAWDGTILWEYIISNQTNDNDIFKIGNSEIRAMFTPGHTYDHNCYLIDEMLLSGDCLFIGDVGRIDLGGDYREKSDLLFDSLRKLEKLDEKIRVYPNHVGAAHAIDSEDTFSTIGNEKKINEALSVKNKDDFYKYMTEGWPPKPDGWEQIIEDNLNI